MGDARLLLAAVWGAATLGCWASLNPPACKVRCSTGATCPKDHMCLEDGYCHEGGDPASCAVEPDDPASGLDGSAAPDSSTETEADAQPDGSFAPDGAPGECVPDETQTEGCYCTGVRRRSCGADGVWRPWDACVGGGVCDYLGSETRTVGCGCGGSVSQACDTLCQWQDASGCIGDQMCTPGDEICSAGRCCWGSGHFCSDEDPSRCCSGVCNGFCT
jgi:hypothetical protein